MKVDFLLNGNTNFTISDSEKLELDQIKLDFENELNDYAINERCDLDILLSTHLLNSHKIAELHNLRSYIISDLDYNSEYKNVISIDTGSVEFKNAELFFLYASSYQILDDTTRGLRILKNITRIKLIERMIEVDYSGNEMKVTFNYNIPYSEKYINIFTPYGFELFDYIDKHYLINEIMTKYSEIYHFLFSNMAPGNGKIKCLTPKYKKFVLEHSKHKFSKVVNSKNDNHLNKYLNGLKDDYINLTGAPLK